MTICVGEVIAVNGVRVTLRIFEDSNKEVLFHHGEKYKGLSIREHVVVQRGFRDIVCLVEGEYLDERRVDLDGVAPIYVRRVEVRPVGYFEDDRFRYGVKYLPMIRDAAHLLEEDRIKRIYSRPEKDGFIIGRLLKEDLPVALPWRKLFNTHLGIFGNTGSGKSNTLAKLYTTLFLRKAQAIAGRSTFVLLDFNGEYVGSQLVGSQQKATYRLSTSGTQGDKFPLDATEFWDVETLSILFQATQNTQRPFLSRLVDGRNRYAESAHALTNYAKSVFKLAFTAAKPKPEALDLLRALTELIGSVSVFDQLKNVAWHSMTGVFYVPHPEPSQRQFFGADGAVYDTYLGDTVDQLDLGNLDAFNQLLARAYLQLVRDLTHGYVQFDHIQPLMKRMEASLKNLAKVLEVGFPTPSGKLLTVISLKRCSNDVKKVLPLLLAKHYYSRQKGVVSQPPDHTLHLIIDEAHNILSQQSAREHESWKDYRLEMFEEIVKEGRKFGVFLAVSSQRPADISQTIVSQLHNFAIHRLVNDRDLALVENTISTLDSISRSMIPTLAQGCCVVTGTSFDLPLLLQVDQLPAEMRPDSEDVDLEALWVEPT